MEQIFLWNRAQADKKSAVRGIGRYIQTLTLGLGDSLKTISTIPNFKLDGIFFDPYISAHTMPAYLRKPGKITIGTIHDMIVLKYPKKFPLGFRRIYALLYRYYSVRMYDAILTDSEASKKDIIEYFALPKDRVHVVYPPVAPHFFRHEPGIQPSLQLPKQYCIYVGDVTWNKNLVVMAQAVIRANIHLVCVGKALSESATDNPWHNEFRAFLQKIRGEHLFTCIGFVPDEELVWLYRNALCNILVSRDEGFGYSFAEASLCDTPSVLSDIPVLREIAGDSALFAPANDVDKIAQSITMYMNAEKRAKIGTSAKARARMFSTEAFVQSFENVLKHI